MNFVNGDLLQLAENGDFNVIVHGCNCFNTMGSGIARQIREKYPAAYAADCATESGDYNKLGTYTVMLGKQFNIVNAYTQYGFNSGGKNEDVFEYVSFTMILQKLAMKYPSASFGFPMIGCGLAGGDERLIMEMLKYFSEKVEQSGGTVTVVKWKQ